jgi:protein involved in polysaccharide export with SLBB domain
MGTIEIVGEVEYPGFFPIVIGKTTLQDVINQAGGMRSTALVRAAYLERGVVELEEHGNVLEEVELFQRRSLPRFFMPLSDSSTVLQQMRLNELDFLSRHYLARSLYQENRVSVDVQVALEPGSDPVYLQDRDRLVVPRDAGSVTVIGEVVRPGAVTFKAGLSAEGYVTAAGGRGPKASDIYIIKSGSGQVVPVGQTPILSGDFVFVNREGGDPTSSDLERLSLQSNDARIRKYQVGLQTVGTVLSVVTTTLLVLNALKN